MYHIIGLPCPACGLTRAFISLARLEFSQAFAYHPLFFMVPVVPFLGLERISSKWRNILAFAGIGVLVAVWVVRMVQLFPHTAPMTFNDNSFTGWLIRLWQGGI
ncbi:MAG: DUF2752 domain-containing protein [Defluviitaleaceae bacterium]|nr:DUF2752 domain-containing protein [Defluviitaleaceae bacterium]